MSLTLHAGAVEEIALAPPEPPAAVTTLAEALGTGAPAGWAQPSTRRRGGARRGAARRLGAAARPRPRARRRRARRPRRGRRRGRGPRGRAERAGVALRRRRAGRAPAARADRGGGRRLPETGAPGRYWVSLERGAGEAVVVSVPVLPDRLATLVVQLEEGRLRLYQFHPALGTHASSAPDRLAARRVPAAAAARRAALDRADCWPRSSPRPPPTTRTPALAASPAAAGPPRLRLASCSARSAASHRDQRRAHPGGEHESCRAGPEAGGQAFLDRRPRRRHPRLRGRPDAAAVEGLRANTFVHPRGALVRHLFQRHARGLMWAAFSPSGRRPRGTRGRGADLGFEGLMVNCTDPAPVCTPPAE